MTGGSVFNAKPCAVVLTGGGVGGGDLFDCYPISANKTTLPLAGTGFSGLWVIGVSGLGTYLGDTFQSYQVESGITATVLGGGTGFSGAFVCDPDIGISGFELFDSYSDGVKASGSMTGGDGFLGAWISE